MEVIGKDRKGVVVNQFDPWPVNRVSLSITTHYVLYCFLAQYALALGGAPYDTPARYCNKDHECDIPAGEGCFWLYDGCDKGMCMCDPKNHRKDRITGLCKPRKYNRHIWLKNIYKKLYIYMYSIPHNSQHTPRPTQVLAMTYFIHWPTWWTSVTTIDIYRYVTFVTVETMCCHGRVII